MGAYPRGVPINLVERFFLIDPLTEVATPTDPTTVTYTVRAPDDTETSYVFGIDGNVTKPTTGVYVCALAPPLPTGTYEYVAIGTGAVQAESYGTFEVLPDGVLPPAPSPVPVPGPCQPWINGDDVAEVCNAGVGSNTFELEDVAATASGLMFELSGRLYNGICERTLRPCADACACFSRSRAGGLDSFYWSLAGGASAWANDCGDRCGCGALSYVPLSGYPVREVIAVKVDGAVLDPTGYRLEEGRRLLRLSDPGPPVVAHSWPACQDLTLDDSQPGTFSIQYRWGIEPPTLGKMAAAQLACEFWKATPAGGGKCALPSKVTKIVRQGVTIERVVALASLLRQGTTGLAFVDAFLAGANPFGVTRRPGVWSPDVTRPGRRIA